MKFFLSAVAHATVTWQRDGRKKKEFPRSHNHHAKSSDDNIESDTVPRISINSYNTINSTHSKLHQETSAYAQPVARTCQQAWWEQHHVISQGFEQNKYTAISPSRAYHTWRVWWNLLQYGVSFFPLETQDICWKSSRMCNDDHRFQVLHTLFLKHWLHHP